MIVRESELKHYGILGMKWGVRRKRRQDAKKAYKKTLDREFSKYENEINRIEKPYKRGQNLSKKDQAREIAADERYQNAAKKAKAEYKRAKKDKSNDVANANKLYSLQSRDVNKAVVNASMGKTIAKSMLMGSAGALTYEYMRSKGQGRLVSGAIGYTSAFLNGTFGQIPANVFYAANRSKRKNK